MRYSYLINFRNITSNLFFLNYPYVYNTILFYFILFLFLFIYFFFYEYVYNTILKGIIHNFYMTSYK